MKRIANRMMVGAAFVVIGALAQVPPVAITHATVLDGRGGAPRPDSTVVVADGVITSVRTGPPPSGAAVIDGRNGHLVPGFIDMHAHLMFPRCAPLANGSVFDRAVSERMLSTLLDYRDHDGPKSRNAND